MDVWTVGFSPKADKQKDNLPQRERVNEPMARIKHQRQRAAPRLTRKIGERCGFRFPGCRGLGCAYLATRNDCYGNRFTCNVGRRHGANFFIEVTRQLRGEVNEERQVPGAEVGVVSNAVGGFASCALLTAS